MYYFILPSYFRFIDSTFVIQYTEHREEFLPHINNADSVIKVTVKDTRTNGSVPFLDTLVTSEHNDNTHYKHLQNTHPYRSVPILGQSSPYRGQVQCHQHLNT